ncbi:hypothetical protein G9409_08645 [Chlorobium sp. BLA1]|nr:hypothetical protein [Candidatus Chlorobium masyuteum]
MTAEESTIYDKLRFHDPGHHIPLGQEKIGFDWLAEVLKDLMIV